MKKTLLLLLSGLLIIGTAGAALAAGADLINPADGKSVNGLIPLGPGETKTFDYKVVGLNPDSLNKDWPYSYSCMRDPAYPGIPGATDKDLVVTFSGSLHPTTTDFVHKGAVTISNNGVKDQVYKIKINAANTYDEAEVTRRVNSIPEFPSVALPVAAILGLMFVIGRKKKAME